MAKQSAPSASAQQQTRKGRFRVAVKGYPVTGFVEEVDGKVVVHASAPVADHFRPPVKLVPEYADSGVHDDWHTERELLEALGLEEVPKGFRRRRRVRRDLGTDLFTGAVVEADSDYEARAEFARQYGLRSTEEANWQIEPAPAGEALGPYGPKKLRGLLRRSA